MNAPIRTAVVAGLLTLGVFTLRFACSPADSQETRRGEELQKLQRATLRREQARRQAVQEWMAQRRSLAETMQRFQELDHDWPDYSEARLREKLPESDVERHYRLILSYARAELQGRSEELATVLRRLENEYQQLQAGR
jgi:hypothetical protein